MVQESSRHCAVEVKPSVGGDGQPSDIASRVMERSPAFRPVVNDQCPEGQIIVLATPVSLASEKYRRLYENYGARAVSLPAAMFSPAIRSFASMQEEPSGRVWENNRVSSAALIIAVSRSE